MSVDGASCAAFHYTDASKVDLAGANAPTVTDKAPNEPLLEHIAPAAGCTLPDGTYCLTASNFQRSLIVDDKFTKLKEGIKHAGEEEQTGVYKIVCCGGGRIATSSQSDLKMWSGAEESSKLLATFKPDDGLKFLEIAALGTDRVVVAMNKVLVIYSFETLCEVARRSFSAEFTQDISLLNTFSVDGQDGICFSHNTSICSIDTKFETLIQSEKSSTHAYPGSGVALDDRFYVSSHDGNFVVWSLPDCQPKFSYSGPKPVQMIAKNGKLFLVSSTDHEMALYNIVNKGDYTPAWVTRPNEYVRGYEEQTDTIASEQTGASLASDLRKAVHADDVAKIRQLIDAGADVNALDMVGGRCP